MQVNIKLTLSHKPNPTKPRDLTSFAQPVHPDRRLSITYQQPIMKLITLASTALAFPLLAQATLNITGSLIYNEHLPDRQSLAPSTVISLDYGEATAFFLEDGSFIFKDIEPGFHVLQVLSKTHSFPELSISLPPASPPFVAPYDPSRLLAFHPSSPPEVGSFPFPLELSARSRTNFNEQQAGFDLKGMFKNPMILLTVGSGLMMFVLPKIISNLDPDAVEEAQRTLNPGRPSSSAVFTTTNPSLTLSQTQIDKLAVPITPVAPAKPGSMNAGSRAGGNRKRK
ncbi:Predicted membrane protein [Phaffia rhodozyma]|uniref:Predicted membrane protein n=1 Tax=Phaffia rhodozyma TaxID=264483 RepID=A0A0F7SJ10_PHARH|nr:Predicted membrane protein [Phaffia rhodozyma]